MAWASGAAPSAGERSVLELESEKSRRRGLSRRKKAGMDGSEERRLKNSAARASGSRAGRAPRGR